ncbi:MAG: aspartate/glutamate racemase family protein [Candidatus Micrarchaeia archaeon]
MYFRKDSKCRKNYEAIVIDRFSDPAFESARGISKIPIIGVNKSFTHLFAQISNKFSIVKALPEVEDLIRRIAAKNGILPRLTSIVTINIPVLSLETNKNFTIEKMVTMIKKAVSQEGTETSMERWAIEDGYLGKKSDTKEKIHSCEIEIRYFLCFHSVLLYDIWILLNFIKKLFAYEFKDYEVCNCHAKRKMEKVRMIKK